jgi:hypothetical protein
MEVKATVVETPAAAPQWRLVFMAGQIRMPDDFDSMGAAATRVEFDAGD